MKPTDFIVKLLQNQRIAKRVNELKLTSQQLMDALPILLDMNQEKDDEKTKFLTSFFLTPTGSVQRSEIKSTYWEKFTYLENVMTQKFFPVDFEDDKKFISEISRKPLIPLIRQYIALERQVNGLFLWGSYGVGKTFILKKIARKLAQSGKKIGFITTSELALKIKSTFGTQKPYDHLLKILREVDYLFIDDIGSEQITSWFRDDILFPLLNERMQQRKTTFFSSNYDLHHLSTIESRTSNGKYLERDKANRLIERIRSLTTTFELRGKNKR